MKSIWPALVAFVAGVLIAGCGGGGGGNTTGGATGGGTGSLWGAGGFTSAPGQLNYSTVWGSAPSAASQLLEIYDADGFLVRGDSVNRSGAVASNLVVSSVPGGVYQLRVRLYASANANGTVLGELSTVLNLCAGGPGGTTANLTTTNANAATRVEVFPASVTLLEQATQEFFATAKSGSQPVFVSPGGVSWSVTGGVGTISDSGQFTATTVGSGTVRASVGTLVGSAAVQVNERVITTSKWTVMVFMNAANDLYAFSDQDVNEMERVADNPDVRFLVQWKQSKDVFAGSSFDGVRRVLVKHDTSGQVVSEVVQNNLRQSNGQHLDMGQASTLRDFVAWTKENYPAERYVLVLWNHGNGWRRSAEDWSSRAFSYDDQFGTSIQIWQLEQALAGLEVDILAWDSSLMQMMEVAYEARNLADYVVGSEESPPGEGYPYDLVFAPFRDNPNASTAALAKGFVDGMLNYAPYNTRRITQSVIDTSRLEALAASLDNLAGELIANLGSLQTAIPNVRETAQSYSPTTTRVYRDIVDLCLRLEADSTVPASVKTACADVRAKVLAAVVWEGHNANSPGSNGLAIDFASSSTFTGVAQDYARMKFAQDTRWDEFLAQSP